MDIFALALSACLSLFCFYDNNNNNNDDDDDDDN